MRFAYQLSVIMTGMMLVANEAEAAETCRFTGSWTMVHANGAVAKMDINDHGGILSGSGKEGQWRGTVERGGSNGRKVSLTIKWNNGHAGRYTGSVTRSGILRGDNYDLTNTASQTTWYTEESFQCKQG
jgi:hypothetical protein